MNYRTFVTYNVIGGIGWGVGVTTLGYFLGQVEFAHDNIEAMILVGTSSPSSGRRRGALD